MNTRIICGSRGSGRTTELIKMSADTGATLVVPTGRQVEVCRCLAYRMGLKIPNPISFRDFIEGRHSLPGGVDYVIDDILDCLTLKMPQSNIIGVTMVSENMINLDDNQI